MICIICIIKWDMYHQNSQTEFRRIFFFLPFSNNHNLTMEGRIIVFLFLLALLQLGKSRQQNGFKKTRSKHLLAKDSIRMGRENMMWRVKDKHQNDKSKNKLLGANPLEENKLYTEYIDIQQKRQAGKMVVMLFEKHFDDKMKDIDRFAREIKCSQMNTQMIMNQAIALTKRASKQEKQALSLEKLLVLLNKLLTEFDNLEQRMKKAAGMGQTRGQSTVLSAKEKDIDTKVPNVNKSLNLQESRQPSSGSDSILQKKIATMSASQRQIQSLKSLQNHHQAKASLKAEAEKLEHFFEKKLSDLLKQIRKMYKAIWDKYAMPAAQVASIDKEWIHFRQQLNKLTRLGKDVSEVKVGAGHPWLTLRDKLLLKIRRQQQNYKQKHDLLLGKNQREDEKTFFI